MSRILYWLLALTIALLLLWQGWLLYPMPESDSLWFLPAAVNYAEGFHLLINNLHPQANLYDPTSSYHFAFYPPGFPWFMGILSPESSPRGVYLLLAALCAAITLITARFLSTVIERQTALPTSTAYRLGIAALLCLATYTSSFCLGRPDYLATLLILCGWAAVEQASPRTIWLWAGGTLGAIAFVQPIGGFFASALFGLWCGVRFDWKRTLSTTIPAFTLAVALLLFLLFINPNGFSRIVQGLRIHSIATLVTGTNSNFFQYFFIHSYAFAYGPVFVGGLIPIFYGLWARRHTLGSPLVVIVSAITSAYLFSRFIAIAWDRFYNLWLLVPCLLIAAFIFGFEQLKGMEKRLAKKWVIAAATLLIIGSLGFIHRAILFGFYLGEKRNYLEARAEVVDLLGRHPVGRIGVSKSLWILFDDYNPVDSFGLDPTDLTKPAKYLFIQQRYTPYEVPPPITGYQLVYDDFEKKKPTLFGIALSPTMPSYRFAFYERLTPGAPLDLPAVTR